MKKYRMYQWFLIIGVIGIFAWLITPNKSLPFSLIDDPLFAGKALLFKNQLLSGQFYQSAGTFLYAFPGLDQGRFAFTWFLWWVGSYSMLGLDPQALHLVLSITVALGTMGLYLIVKKLAQFRWAALLSVFFYSTLSLGYESWLRFSPQEAIQTLSLVVLLLILLKRKRFDWMGHIGLLAFLFSKENSLLLSPSLFLGGFLLENKKLSSKFKKAGMWGMFYGAIILLGWWFGLRSHSNWAGSSASMGNVISSLKTYFGSLKRLWIVHLLSLSILGGVYLWFNKPATRQPLRKAGVFLLMAGFSLGALLPWEFALERYLMPFSMLLAGFFGIVWYLMGIEVIDLLKGKKRLLSVLLFSLLAGLVMIKFTYVNILELNRIQQNYLARETSNHQLMERLSELPEESRVVINVKESNLHAREWVERMPLYLKMFYKRDDIEVEFLEPGRENISSNTLVADWSLYHSDYEPGGELIWQDKRVANEMAVGLKDLLLISGGIDGGEIWGERVYSWKLHEVN